MCDDDGQVRCDGRVEADARGCSRNIQHIRRICHNNNKFHVSTQWAPDLAFGRGQLLYADLAKNRLGPCALVHVSVNSFLTSLLLHWSELKVLKVLTDPST